MLSTIFHNSWQSGRVNLIFSTFNFELFCNHSHLNTIYLFRCMEENRREFKTDIIMIEAYIHVTIT